MWSALGEGTAVRAGKHARRACMTLPPPTFMAT